MPKKTKPKAVSCVATPLTPITAKERREIHKRIKKRQEQLRKRHPEIHGKVLDSVAHSVQDGTLYVSIRFKDKTHFSIRYACQMLVVGVDLSDMTTGNLDMIRQYMKPIPR